MSAQKIGAFYDDPVKRAGDDFARSKAYSLKAFSLSDALPWRARRVAKFLMQYAVGTLRRLFGEQGAPARNFAPVIAERDVTLVPAAPMAQRVKDPSTQTAA
jgi:hypothetical protein